MIVVADSGSTKTEWRLCTNDRILASADTTGLNPLALDKDSTISEVENSEIPIWVQEGEVEEVHFYGAGIVDNTQREVAAKNLQILFKEASITVNSDLLGAGRAVFGNNQGIIGILGTGSNSGFYDGETISSNIPALGYILGDEGSGSVMGRTLIKHFLRNELSKSLSEDFRLFYQEYDSLIETVYSKKHAGRFLASFAPFLYEHKDDIFIKKLVLSELNKFIKLLRTYSSTHTIGIVGSIGYYFQSELNLLAQNAELKIVDYLINPIDKLAEYHQSKAQ